MSPRQIIVVDTEATGLDPDVHGAVEVAWWNLDTDARGCFVPPHEHLLPGADPRALALNHYADRIAPRPVDERYEQTRLLYAQLHHNTLAGSNPAFDSEMLTGLFHRMWSHGPEDPLTVADPQLASPARPWHHRLFDLAAYAAGVLGLDPHELRGLDAVCERLGMRRDQGRAHGSGYDVGATVACFRVLMARAAAREGEVPAT